MDELAVALNIDPIELRIRNGSSESPEMKVPFSARTLAPACKRARQFPFGGAATQRPERRETANGSLTSAAIRGNPMGAAKASVLLDRAMAS
jgi:xanthine dehydrogenase YagR molybdenum-binding subunit